MLSDLQTSLKSAFPISATAEPKMPGYNFLEGKDKRKMVSLANEMSSELGLVKTHGSMLEIKSTMAKPTRVKSNNKHWRASPRNRESSIK